MFILLASVPFLIPIDVSLSNLFTIASPLGTWSLTILTLVSTAISPSSLPHLAITSLFTPLLTKLNTHAFNSSPTISPFFVLPLSYNKTYFFYPSKLYIVEKFPSKSFISSFKFVSTDIYNYTDFQTMIEWTHFIRGRLTNSFRLLTSNIIHQTS